MPKGKTVSVGNIPANIAVDGDKVVQADVTVPIPLSAPNLATTPTAPDDTNGVPPPDKTTKREGLTPAEVAEILQSEEVRSKCRNIRLSCDTLRDSLFGRWTMSVAVMVCLLLGMFAANIGQVPWFAAIAILCVFAVIAWYVAYAILWMISESVYWLTASRLLIALIPVAGLVFCQNAVGWSILLACMVAILWMRAWLGSNELAE